MRTQMAAANWKMNLNLQEAEQLLESIKVAHQPMQQGRVTLLAVPFPYLLPALQIMQGVPGIFIAAQNCAATKNGAYTGEVSASMLAGLQVQYVIIGHSERREYFQENHAILSAKVNLAMEAGLKPVFCCGEPLAVREAGNQNQYVAAQLEESLFHLTAEQMNQFIIAYEPIWAIGTGKTATAEQAQDMHAHIRKTLAEKYGEEIASSISVLYGGSVKGSNAAEIFGKPDVDGGLVGGASLVATEFITIMNSLK